MRPPRIIVLLSGLLFLHLGVLAADSPAPPPPPLLTEFVYEAEVTLSPAVEVGTGIHGKRRYIPITGGTFSGPGIRGVVLPGGADWQTERADGATEVDALYSIKCEDGTVIIVHNRGLITGGNYLRTIPEFDAPKGPHDWLNRSVYVGSVSFSPKPATVIIRVFRVL